MEKFAFVASATSGLIAATKKASVPNPFFDEIMAGSKNLKAELKARDAAEKAEEKAKKSAKKAKKLQKDALEAAKKAAKAAKKARKSEGAFAASATPVCHPAAAGIIRPMVTGDVDAMTSEIASLLRQQERPLPEGMVEVTASSSTVVVQEVETGAAIEQRIAKAAKANPEVGNTTLGDALVNHKRGNRQAERNDTTGGKKK